MADKKLSELTELAATPASDDELYIRDVSEVASSESKRITVTNLMDAAARTATLIVAANDATAKSKAGADYVCDGIADDVQIQAVYAALPASGGEIKLSEGTFVISAEILPVANSKLSGVGRYNTILQATGGTLGVVQVNVNNTEFCDFGIDINNIPTSGLRTSYTAAAAKCYIERLYIYGCNLVSVSPAIQYYDVDGGYVKDCHIDATSGQGILASYGCRDVRIENNYIYHSYDNAIEVYGAHATAYPVRVIVANNIIVGLGTGNGRGIVTGGNCQYISIHDNLISGATYGIDVETTVATRLPKFVKIHDNTVWGSTTIDCRVYTNQDPTEDVTVIDNEFMTSAKAFSQSGTHTRLTIARNRGYDTENSGTATLLNANTAIVVAHGCSATPTFIGITWKENPTNVIGDWWVDTIGATNFTLNGVDPGASNLDFMWEAKVR